MNTKNLIPIISLPLLVSCQVTKPKETTHPNVILVMADDLGYGDVGFQGNPTVKTPNLDSMARRGITFSRFYSAGPVCSPTRASCLTGRHPYRTGVPWAGEGAIHKEELTIAELFKSAGYTTGHFGKWHVGGLSKTVKQSYFSGHPTPYSPPWENGFDCCFTTESMMPTYNPYYHVGGNFGTKEYKHIQDQAVERGQKTDGFRWRDVYWTGPGQFVDEWLEGDDSKHIMDRALEFIDKKNAKKDPFLALIWFHTPHTPVVTGPEHRSLYPDQSMQGQHWYGAISAMDQQVGRLRQYLKDNGLSENTIIWFCSDNGPSYIHNFNSTGGLKGKKAELLEGGIRVPSILEWPAKFKSHKQSDHPIYTSDLMPTVAKAANISIPDSIYLDGENVLPIIEEPHKDRKKKLFFRSPLPNRLKKHSASKAEQWAVMDERYKLISMDNGKTHQLYDLKEDPGETKDMSGFLPKKKKELLESLEEWFKTLPTE